MSSRTPTLIRELQVERLDVPLRQPFGIAGGAQAKAQNLLVRVRLQGGSVGYGEAAPLPAYNGETQGAVEADLERLRSDIEGRDAASYRSIARGLAELRALGASRCAVEVAVLDALTRHAGLDLLHFFGGATRELETDMTITTGTLQEASVAARSIQTAGFRTIKLKVGGRPLAEDLERLRAVCDAAPGTELIVDANASLSAGEAVALVRAACEEEIPLALFEQPCAAEDLQGLSAVRAVGGCPVAADESATSAESVLRLASMGAVDVINIKLMKCGVVEALDMVSVAKAAGLRLMIGGNVETRLAMGASACFAAGLGGFEFVDLDTPLFLAEDPFDGGYVQRGPRLDLRAPRRGHGVVPRD